VAVRVVEYRLDDPGRPQAEPRYRLLTTILDPRRAPAEELAGAYAERWEFETALDEFKTHQRGPRVVLRSKMPDGVRQEIWGYLCVHHAIRWLMHTVAIEATTDPDRLSFTRTLRAARRSGGAVAVLASERARSAALRWLFVAIGVLVPLVVALSRVYRGMHFVTDVLGGMILGATWLFVTIRAIRLGVLHRQLREGAQGRLQSGRRGGTARDRSYQ